MNDDQLLEHNKRRRIQQIGIVVAELEKYIDAMQTVFRLGPWRIINCNEETLDIKVRRDDWVKEHFHYRLATAMIGDVQIELIEPNETVPMYMDFLTKYGGGIHHIREQIEDGGMDAVLEHYNGKGMETVFGGQFGSKSFYYVDSIPKLNVLLEFSGSGALQKE